jgi:flagellar basal body-associated protein FliL
MDFRTIFQLRNKKVWWIDVIFYFVIALLTATIICYLVFLVKNIFQRRDIAEAEYKLTTVGTADQLTQEQKVILYKAKIKDFGNLIQNHEFASNIFYLMQDNTQPKVWFSQFNLDAKAKQVQVSGIAEDMDMVARQTSTFEKNEYIQKFENLNSTLSEDGRIAFNFSLSMNPRIFSYAVNRANQAVQEEKENVVVVSGSISQVENQPEEGSSENSEGSTTPVEGGEVLPKSSDKMIFSFSTPVGSEEIIGQIDHTGHTILLNFTSGTDITNLTPLIIISDKARVYPETGVPQNFTNPIDYQVTAEDGTTQNYVVSAQIVKSAEEIAEEQKKEKNMGLVIFLLIVASVVLVAVSGLMAFIYIRRRQNKKQRSVKK